METKSELLNHASILVTGSSGMLGQALVKRLSKANQVLGVSKSGRGNSRACDLSQPAETEKVFSNNFDLVIHTAAYSDVDGCEKEPALAQEANAVATKNLAQACGRRNIPFIYVSTDYVFDGKKKSPYTESDATCPVNIYGLTKLEGEFFTRRYAPIHAIVRTSWLFGEGPQNSFVNAILMRLKTETLVRVLDDQEDSPTSVEDLSEALERIGARLVSDRRSGKAFQDTFHVCNSGSTTRYGLTLKIKECLGLEKTRVEKIDKEGIQNRVAVRPAYGVLSSSRYESFFGRKIRPWQESLKDYVNERKHAS